MKPPKERTLEDFPIGSRWINSGYPDDIFEVVKYRDGKIVFKITECTYHSLTVGQEFSYPPNTWWPIPCANERDNIPSSSETIQECLCDLWNGCTCGVFEAEQKVKK
jgi:hypothetical protein